MNKILSHKDEKEKAAVVERLPFSFISSDALPQMLIAYRNGCNISPGKWIALSIDLGAIDVEVPPCGACPVFLAVRIKAL